MLKVHWSPGEEWQPELIDLNVKRRGFLHKVGTLLVRRDHSSAVESKSL